MDLVFDMRLTGDAVSSTNHAHDLKALYCGVGGLHRLKSSGGGYDPLQRAMISLDDVVQIFGRAMLRIICKLAFSLQSSNGFWIGAELVCGDR